MERREDSEMQSGRVPSNNLHAGYQVDRVTGHTVQTDRCVVRGFVVWCGFDSIGMIGFLQFNQRCALLVEAGKSIVV